MFSFFCEILFWPAIITKKNWRLSWITMEARWCKYFRVFLFFRKHSFFFFFFRRHQSSFTFPILDILYKFVPFFVTSNSKKINLCHFLYYRLIPHFRANSTISEKKKSFFLKIEKFPKETKIKFRLKIEEKINFQ